MRLVSFSSEDSCLQRGLSIPYLVPNHKHCESVRQAASYESLSVRCEYFPGCYPKKWHEIASREKVEEDDAQDQALDSYALGVPLPSHSLHVGHVVR